VGFPKEKSLGIVKAESLKDFFSGQMPPFLSS